MTRPTELDPTLTINEIVAQFPETIVVFNRLGMDACCGGAETVREAALRDGLDLKVVLAQLDEAILEQ